MGHDLNAAALFVRVVEAGSLRGAALAAGVPKSTVSRRLQALEAQLGAELLQRTTRRLRLTDLGRAYYEEAARAVQALLDAERSLAGQLKEPRGSLRITAPVNVGVGLLPEITAAFLQAHPAVTLTVDLSERVVDLVAEGFDAALRAGSLPDSSLVAHRLGGAEIRTYASPRYLARSGRPQVPADLRQHACLRFGEVDEWVFGRKARERVSVSGPLRANNIELLRGAAVAGLGLARMPAVLAEPAVRAGQLEAVLEAYVPDQVPLHIVYPSTRFVTPALRAFVELCKERWGKAPIGGAARPRRDVAAAPVPARLGPAARRGRGGARARP